MSGPAVEIPFGRAAALEVPAGGRLVVEIAEGRQLADVTVLGLDQAVTRNAAGWRRFRRPSLAVALEAGDALLDGAGERIGEVTDPGPGALDAVYPGCWRAVYEDGRPGCRDLLAEALGVEPTTLPGVLSAFGTPSRLANGGIHGWEGTAGVVGSRVILTLDSSVRVAVSACPDDGIPGSVPGALRVWVEDDRSAGRERGAA